MNPNRFDHLSRMFARQVNRRLLIASGLGLAGSAAAARASAQDGTPEATPVVDPNDPHPSADDSLAGTEFLFVQPFDSGNWESKDGEDGQFVLTLSGVDAHTIYFSDRPERITGLAPTQQFLDGLGFTPADPPNAALVANQDGEGSQDVLLIELYNPVYDSDAGTLTYDAKFMSDYGEPGLAHLAQQQQDFEFAQQFSDGSLFIDDCGGSHADCVAASNGTYIGGISIGCCYNWNLVQCASCYSSTGGYAVACEKAYPDACRNNQCVGLSHCSTWDPR